MALTRLTSQVSCELFRFACFPLLLWGWLHSVYPQHGVNRWQQKNLPKKPMANCKSKPVWPNNEWVKFLAGWRSWPKGGTPPWHWGGLTTPTMALHAIWSMRKCQLFCSLGKSNAIVFHRILEKTLYKGAARNPILRRDIQFRKEIKCESFDGACCIHRAMMPRC